MATREQEEQWLDANCAVKSRSRDAQGNLIQPKEIVSGAVYEYSYEVQYVLGEACQVMNVKLQARGTDPTSEAIWVRGRPANPLKSSVSSVEETLKTWIAGHIAGYKGLLPITQSQLATYPRWVVARCLVESAGSVSLKDYCIYQAEGQAPVAYPYVSA